MIERMLAAAKFPGNRFVTSTNGVDVALCGFGGVIWGIAHSRDPWGSEYVPGDLINVFVDAIFRGDYAGVELGGPCRKYDRLVSTADGRAIAVFGRHEPRIDESNIVALEAGNPGELVPVRIYDDGRRYVAQ
jgi:hypothetical protein